MKPDVSIITLTYNKQHLIESCVKHLLKFAIPQTELILVDNGNDGSAFYIRQKYDRENFQVKIINHDNSGSFATMNNLAARHAEGEYLIFLNNDVDLITPWTWAIEYLMQVPLLGAVGAVLMHTDNKLQHAGVVFQENAAPTNLGVEAITGLGLDDTLCHPTNWPMSAVRFQAVTGAFLACRKSDFRTIGGFDGTFTWAFEDVDLCLRLFHLLGKFTVCSRDIVGFHHESASGGRRNIEFNLAAFRGRWGAIIDSDYDMWKRDRSIQDLFCSSVLDRFKTGPQTNTQ